MSGEISWSLSTPVDEEERQRFHCTDPSVAAPRWMAAVEDFLCFAPAQSDSLLVGRDRLGIAALVRWNSESVQFPLLRAYAVAWRRQGERPSVAGEALAQMLTRAGADAKDAGYPAVLVEARIDTANIRSQHACLKSGFVSAGLVEPGIERWMYRKRL